MSINSLVAATALLTLAGCQSTHPGQLEFQDFLSIDECPETRTEGDRPLSYYRPPPRYPSKAVAEKLSGRVLVEGDFTRDGRLLNPRVIAYEPSPIFNEVALEAVRRWRYCPISNDSPAYPTPYRVVIPFSYQ